MKKKGLNMDIIKNMQNKKRLRNTLDFINDICLELAKSPERTTDIIFKLVKLYTDCIVTDRIFGVMERKYFNNFSFWNLMFENTDKISKNIINSIEYIKLPQKICLQLSEIPIIVSPHSRNKLIKNIISVNTDKENWRQQTGINAQGFILYLPIGITFLNNNGNHSVTGGYIKNAGEITISKDNPYTRICDMSKLYDLIWFDGVNYRLISKDKIISKAVSFEFGTAFEIGRIIKNNNISFTYNK